MPVNNSKRFVKQSIPTIVGMLFLIVALISGLILFKDGFSGFMPRANPQTTPKDIRISNLTNSSFTVSFYTEEPTFAKINYGVKASSLNNRIRDERDQFQEKTGEYNLHYITLQNLSPETDYYFSIDTEAGEIKGEDGGPFKVATLPVSTASTLAKTLYGNVMASDGSPADGSIIYLKIPGFEELSSLVKSSGSWAISLSEARSIKTRKIESVSDSSNVSLVIKGARNLESIVHETTLSKSQPVEDLKLQKNIANDQATVSPAPENSSSGEVRGVNTTDKVDNDSANSRIINLHELDANENPETVSNPIIRGQAAADSKIKISIHSDNQIETEVTSNSDGWFEVNLENLGESLEPGNHTISYTYMDPDLGLEITKERNFTVSGDSQLIAQAIDDAEAFGSGNPYSTPTPTVEITMEPTAIPTVVVEPLPEAGSGDTTILIIMSGLFFFTAGIASWKMAKVVVEED